MQDAMLSKGFGRSGRRLAPNIRGYTNEIGEVSAVLQHYKPPLRQQYVGNKSMYMLYKPDMAISGVGVHACPGDPGPGGIW